jgi:aspartate aminotransferase
MYSNKMYELGSKSSVIREIFEFGLKRKAEVGEDNVYDFSIGNPNVPAPDCVKEAIVSLLENETSSYVHGYTSAQGDMKVREAIAASLNTRFGTDFKATNLYMTMGAAASISLCVKATVTSATDEFVTFAPFFTEYKVWVEAAGASLKVVPANVETFQIDFEKFEAILSPQTKGVIVNSPNNPSGVVYSEATIIKLCEILKQKSEVFGHPIYLIADEPYREIVYGDLEVPFLTKYYENTFVCYSYSKTLSLPGERIGYVLVPDAMADSKKVYAAICGAGRALGYVCAPSLFQKVVMKCLGETADIGIYKTNRDLIYQGLTALGYDCVMPQGAFYLFVKALEADANKFSERARDYDLLIVPSDDFGVKGYVRISYCVSTAQIEKSLPAFAKLAESYR